MRKRVVTLAALLILLLGILSSFANAATLDPPTAEVTMKVGETRTVNKVATIPAAPPLPVDVYFLVDTTGSFTSSLPVFKAAVNDPGGIIDTLVASGLDVWFGAADFRDYPISSFGASGVDYAYRRHIPVSNDVAAVKAAINSISIGSGADIPESQLPALYQTVTGAGQDLSGAGYPGASIPAGQQAGFRSGAVKLILLWTDASFHLPGDAGSIPYPGPSMAATIAALNSSGVKVAGVLAGGEVAAGADLSAVATGTSTLAPAGGVDCDNNGSIDLAAGAPLVCPIAASGAGIAEAIAALVGAVTSTADISLQPLHDPLGQFVSATPAVYPNVDLTVDNVLTFTETFTCPAGSENTSTVVTMGLVANGGVLAQQLVTVNCQPARLDVEIDVKPGQDPNECLCNYPGYIPVALLSTPTFDATSADPNTVRWGKTGTEAKGYPRDFRGNVRPHRTDVNGDGLIDLVFLFKIGDSGFSCADIPDGSRWVEYVSIMTGTTMGGDPFIGYDLIRLYR